MIRVNVCGTLALVDSCNSRGIHATLYATGCIYEYDKDHPVRALHPPFWRLVPRACLRAASGGALPCAGCLWLGCVLLRKV